MFDRVDPPAAGGLETAMSVAVGSRRNQELADVRKRERLSPSERHELQRWARQRSLSHRLVVRSRIVLLAAEGLPARSIASRLHVTPATVRLWLGRFADGGLAGLIKEAPGRGRPRGGSGSLARSVLAATRAHAGQGLTVRDIAASAHASPSTVWRVWRRYGLGPNSSAESVDAALAQITSETGQPR
jgi:transposase